MKRNRFALTMFGLLLAVPVCLSRSSNAAAPASVAAPQPAVAPAPRPEAGKPASYVPQFTAAKTELGHYWIEDHGKRLALFGCSADGTKNYEVGLFRHFPGQAIDEEKIKDSAVLGFLGTPGMRLLTDWISAPAMQDVPGEMKVDASDPTHLVVRLSWKKSAEEFGTQVIRFTYDQELARYVVRIEDTLQVNTPGGGEYCNFYANGLGDFRPDHGRYDRLIFNDADNGDKLTSHYLSVILPKPNPGSLIHLPVHNALVGYVDSHGANPVVIVEDSNPHSTDGICLCWFDSHFWWDEARTRNAKTGLKITPAVAGPPYHYYARLKAYWNTEAETQALLAMAQTVSLKPFAERFESSLPVEMNKVNDFEHYADYLSGNVKHIYVSLLPMRAGGGIVYDNKTGHSGNSSIHFVSKSDKGLHSKLNGPELMVTPGRQVKVSAWVKTENVTGEGFYLETGFLHAKQQIGPMYSSKKLTGTHDWTLLEIPLPVTPPESVFLGEGRITLHLSGQGSAWVDDFVFSEQDAGGAAARDSHALVKP